MRDSFNSLISSVLATYQNRPQLFVGFLTLLLGFTGIIAGIYLCVSNNQIDKKMELVSTPSTSSIISHEPEASIASSSGVVVDVSGAVSKPGLYELPEGSRVFNALEKAGGFTRDADSDFIQKELNLAEKVKEGQKIYFPPYQKETDSQASSTSSKEGSDELISINSASAAELDRLPGIGEKLAERIIASRPYENVEELVTKAKVGQAVFDKLKELIKI